MPTYIYRCDECVVRTRGNCDDIEQTHSIKENPLYVCPRCGDQLRRVPQATGIVLKGQGFYKNDSKPKDNN
jgi:predicted nucleic acid-binding Zn ribbon protein